MQHIGTFLLAVASEWVALMSGAVSLAIAIWLQITKKPWISSVVFKTIGVACMFFAFYGAWYKEHTELLKHIETNQPQFVLKLGQGFALLDLESNKTIIFIQTELINRGADSVAINWAAHYKSTTIDKDIGVIIFPEDYIEVSPRLGKLNYIVKREDLIIYKTTTAIKRGNMVAGPILLSIEGDKSIEISGDATITISTEDYLGRKYQARFKGSGQEGELKYYPGATVKEKRKRGIH
jgi:hypothetical protein